MSDLGSKVREQVREAMGLRIAISGSRDVSEDVALSYIRGAFRACRWPVSRIHHGGAEGVDQAASTFADELNVPEIVFHPDWDEHGNAAGPIRNDRMLKASDALIAVRLNGSPGTTDAIKKAHKYNLNRYIIDIHD